MKVHKYTDCVRIKMEPGPVQQAWEMNYDQYRQLVNAIYLAEGFPESSVKASHWTDSRICLTFDGEVVSVFGVKPDDATDPGGMIVAYKATSVTAAQAVHQAYLAALEERNKMWAGTKRSLVRDDVRLAKLEEIWKQREADAEAGWKLMFGHLKEDDE